MYSTRFGSFPDTVQWGLAGKDASGLRAGGRRVPSSLLSHREAGVNMGEEHRVRGERMRECKQSRGSMACVPPRGCSNEKLKRMWSAAGGGVVCRPRARWRVEGAVEGGGCGRGGRAGKGRRSLAVTEGATVLLGGPGEKSGLAMRGGRSGGPHTAPVTRARVQMELASATGTLRAFPTSMPVHSGRGE